MKLSIVVPCYNEARSIPLILNAFSQALHRNDVEMIIVNNGSSDDSGGILEQLKPRYPFCKVVEVKVNQGYGFGIISGLRAAQGEYIGWIHGDAQTPPSDALVALEIIEQRGNPAKMYVKGRRKGRPLFDEMFTWGMGIFESIFLGEVLWDINAQPNIFHRSFFESWENPPHDFALDLYALYTAKKQKIPLVRFAVLFSKRIHGASHWNKNLYSKWKFIKRTVGFSFALKKRLQHGSFSKN